LTPTQAPGVELLRRTCAAALEQATHAIFLGSLPIEDIDQQRAAMMASARRLWNEQPDDAWGDNSDRHRGDEATQQKTWFDGCLGEAVVGRVLRAARNSRVVLSAPLEWVPTTEPDLVYKGKLRNLRADFKTANYKRPDGRTSWTLNEGAHLKADVDGYLAIDLAAEAGQARVWYYTKAAVEATGDRMHRPSKSGTPSSFYRLFFPPA